MIYVLQAFFIQEEKEDSFFKWKQSYIQAFNEYPLGVEIASWRLLNAHPRQKYFLLKFREEVALKKWVQTQDYKRLEDVAVQWMDRKTQFQVFEQEAL